MATGAACGTQGGGPRLGPAALVAFTVFLLFIAFPAIFVVREASPPRAAVVLAGAAAFVGLYLWTMLTTPGPRAARRSVAVLAALALALSLGDPRAWSMLFIYVAAAAGLRLPAPVAERVILACTVAAGGIALLQGYNANDVVTFTVYAVGIGFLLLGYARLVAVNEALGRARGELARLAVAEERLRFARDLHDLLGHSLSVIALKSELARRLLPVDAGRAAVELDDIERVSREALVEVREAVSGYRRTTLADELQGARTALAAAGIAVEVERDPGPMPDRLDALLGWAVREGATNVLRHSGARSCSIRVRPAAEGGAEVEIADDGRGAPDGAGAGSGLAGLGERVSAHGGRLETGRAAGGGFRLRVTVPAA